MSARAFDAIVIGAGADGLVAACRLSKAGRRVLVLDAADAAGGERRILEFAPGFRAAPCGIDPGWVPSKIAAALDLAGLARSATDTPLSVPVDRGSFLTLPRDAGRAAAAIAPHSPGDAARWPAFTALVGNFAGFLEALYQVPAPDVDIRSIGDFLTLLSLGKTFRSLGKRDMMELLRTLPMSVWELLDDWFECGPLKAAVATAGIQDFQQGPRSGGTGYVLIHHLAGAQEGAIRGRTPWQSGPGALTDSAVAAAQRLGVTIRLNAPLERIQVRDDAAMGVVLKGGEEIPAKAVLSTVDPATTFLDWVDSVWLDPEFVHAIRNIRHRGCTAFVLYGLDALPEAPGLAREALAGIVSLTPDVVSLERAADAAKYGHVSEHPHVELNAPTLLAPSLAPSGRHVLIARVQYAPYRLNDGKTWGDAHGSALAEKVTSTIEATFPGFRSRIAHRVALTPADLEKCFGLREGAASQGEIALDQILFMRPVAGWGRHVTPIENLFLGGAGTHPGPGVLGGAGWLAAARMLASPRAGR